MAHPPTTNRLTSSIPQHENMCRPIPISIMESKVDGPSNLYPPPSCPSYSSLVLPSTSVFIANVNSSVMPSCVNPPNPSLPPPIIPTSFPLKPSSRSSRGESISAARRAAATARSRRNKLKAQSDTSELLWSCASTRSNVSQSKGKRAKRIKWRADEVQALREGVERHGEGKWAVILREYAERFHRGRISVDLKDKWRNMVKAKTGVATDVVAELVKKEEEVQAQTRRQSEGYKVDIDRLVEMHVEGASNVDESEQWLTP